MENLSRIEISNRLLSELYSKYSYLDDGKISELFHSFLVSENNPLTQDLCRKYDIDEEQLRMNKNDMILEILSSGYGYLRYVKTFCKIPEIEEAILSDLESLSFSVEALVDYFKNPLQKEKMKELLIDYFVYRTQDDNFILGCQEYLFNEFPEFYERIQKLIRYVELMDFIAIIHDEVTKKYESEDFDEYELFDDEEESEEEDYEESYEGSVLEMKPVDYESEYDEEEDPYELMIQMKKLEREKEEIFARIMKLLEESFEDKCDMDDFVGYCMSYVYAFLLKERQEGPMAIEDEEMLKLLSQKKLSFELVVESFYASKDYVFNSVDLFAEEYYSAKGDIFGIREKFSGKVDNERFNLLDSYYEGPELDYEIIYIGSPIIEVFQSILADIYEKNPTDYVGEIWQLLRDPDFDCSIFKEYGLDLRNLEYYRVLMMRYLARKYVEFISFKPISSFDLGELYVYQGLMHIEVTPNNMKLLFDMGYYFMIPAYYELLGKSIPHEKCIIRRLRSNGLLPNIVKLDSSCVTDSVYRKALQESEFYSILEVNGEQTTISYLKHLAKTEKETVIDYLKELLVSDYYYAKEGNLQDPLSLSIFRLIEGEGDIKEYLHQLLENEALLKEMLSRYLAMESKTEYSLSYQEKLETSPKVKQKLYPRDIPEKG